jgi:hypothetical protein
MMTTITPATFLAQEIQSEILIQHLVRAGREHWGEDCGTADRKFSTEEVARLEVSRGRAKDPGFCDFVNQVAHRNAIPGFDPVHQPVPI